MQKKAYNITVLKKKSSLVKKKKRKPERLRPVRIHAAGKVEIESLCEFSLMLICLTLFYQHFLQLIICFNMPLSSNSNPTHNISNVSKQSFNFIASSNYITVRKIGSECYFTLNIASLVMLNFHSFMNNVASNACNYIWLHLYLNLTDIATNHSHCSVRVYYIG